MNDFLNITSADKRLIQKMDPASSRQAVESLLWLDARRLLCPLPVIRLQERIQQLVPGDRLEMVFSDKGSLADITAWCRLHGHQILAHHHESPAIFITVQVGSH